jgi:anti-sigma-K factor RskA
MSDEPDELIGDYVLGELEAEERRRLEGRLREDPALGERVEGLEAIGSLLESLPGEAWETLGPRPGGVPERDRRRAPARRRLLLRLQPGLVAAACTVLLGAGIAIGVAIERPGGPGGPTVVLHGLAGGQSTERAVARMTPDGRMVLSVQRLPPTGPNSYYELWLMNSLHDLVAVASFRVGADGRAELDVPLPVAASHYRYLDISLQQSAAGPAHSGDSVLRAPIPA